MGNRSSKPRKSKSRLPGVKKRHWSLLDLSDDVLLRIYNFLGPADGVSFALSSRRLYATLSKPGERFMVQGTDRLKLLQRLERDAVSPMSILCAVCESFHRPRLTNEWNAKEATRACVQSGDGEVYGKTTLNLFPTYVHFDLVTAITRSRRHHLASYSPQLLESTIKFTHVSAQIICKIHAKVIDGCLIVKIEKILYTGYRRNACQGLPNLVELLTREDDLGSCCPYIRWAELHPVVFRPNEEDRAEREKCACLWEHPGSCWRNQKLKPQPTKCRGEVTPELSKIWGYHYCHTDMTISYRYFDEPSDVKMVTLTAWKDLGRGISIDDPTWKTHSVNPGVPSRHRDVGSLYHLFEGKEGSKASIPYMPEFKEKLFEESYGSHEQLPASFTT